MLYSAIDTELHATHVEVTNGLVQRALAASNSKMSQLSASPGNGRSAAGPASSPSPPTMPASPVSGGDAAQGIVNKPVRGWLHPDHLFQQDGINFNVRVRREFFSSENLKSRV